MTESSANLQRIKLEAAVKNCGDYGRSTTDIVDMLLTLKRKERSLCLFNPDFLKEKVQLALDALNTCEEEEEDSDEDEGINGVESQVEELGFPVDYLKRYQKKKRELYIYRHLLKKNYVYYKVEVTIQLPISTKATTWDDPLYLFSHLEENLKLLPSLLHHL
ncbi:hypothetical protein K501DRAFT_101366 [Backusella circina FSU 941]|nr:hypothetical protein K501DRAFT_101366 [Backusella circina FSU 941]